MKEPNENWEYDTKCRRCGKIQYWHFSPKKQTDVSQFHIAMIDMMAYPRVYECIKCKKSTVQDIVSYN